MLTMIRDFKAVEKVAKKFLQKVNSEGILFFFFSDSPFTWISSFSPAERKNRLQSAPASSLPNSQPKIFQKRIPDPF
jgi:hypothetical protein